MENKITLVNIQKLLKKDGWDGVTELFAVSCIADQGRIIEILEMLVKIFKDLKPLLELLIEMYNKKEYEDYE